MASLHLCSPSTHHKTHLPSFVGSRQSNHYVSFLPFSLSLFHNRIRTSHLVLHFSSTTQDPVVDSSEHQPQLRTNTEKGKEGEFSRTRLLAQNVPWTCTTDDIRALFQKFGTVLDVELSMHSQSRNRGLAFVTMGSPEEADNALINLESFEFQGRCLKMNYAKLRKKKPSPSPPPFKKAPTFNLFVSNLPFEAKAQDIKELFDAEGANIVSAEIVYNSDNPRRPSGYGFVAFKTKKEADDALSTFSGKELMGRPIRIARSRQFVREPTEQPLQFDDSSAETDESNNS
ncbi:28 kDa ribonucleoprotein, chloroplastic [Euphorbia lathyris]|uniref:28 kDa ribonucleoprotein, chloroplastic n=1 Tax=Euphorbia lathyris TaxID=212925 RepID=UPI003313F566